MSASNFKVPPYVMFECDEPGCYATIARSADRMYDNGCDDRMLVVLILRHYRDSHPELDVELE